MEKVKVNRIYIMKGIAPGKRKKKKKRRLRGQEEGREMERKEGVRWIGRFWKEHEKSFLKNYQHNEWGEIWVIRIFRTFYYMQRPPKRGQWYSGLNLTNSL